MQCCSIRWAIAPQDEFRLRIAAGFWQRKDKRLIEVCKAGRESYLEKGGVGKQLIIDYFLMTIAMGDDKGSETTSLAL